MKTIALLGNPNCGKTTLFNVLTGTHQRVGNWPGVTVEKKEGDFSYNNNQFNLVDLPGAYSLNAVSNGIDERIAREYVDANHADVVVNVIDGTSLSRGLYLTHELIARSPTNVVVAINMLDVAKHHGIEIDTKQLQSILGVPVVEIIATKRQGIDALKQVILQSAADPQPSEKPADHSTQPTEFDWHQSDDNARFNYIDLLVNQASKVNANPRTATQRIDSVVLNPWLAFPIFLGVMYLMFLISINVGSAFIDLFDLAGSAIFVELPRQMLEALSLPSWLIVFIADGVGGGIQLVGTFIPVIGALFLVLAFLEDSGYMARVAFIVDRSLRKLGLPGKSFVPLIVGFGCNVPAVMATRALDSQPDRILTTLMAPFMSCGARLTVYALFAAAFFPRNGQNVVFALYLIGIIVAVLSALMVRKHLIPERRSSFILELPAYHMPALRNILLQTWQRLKGFVMRAGKAIVLVVIALNVLNSIGTDGSVGNENSKNSVLSEIGRTITPVFAPMGISEENWPATVGIFTGIFAKEVVVGTLDALYAPAASDDEVSISDLLTEALASVPANLADLGSQLADPLGLDLGDLSDLDAQAESQEVQINTIGAMQNLFDGQVGAFAYLLFILLYMPCVATIGVVLKEIGAFWAGFSVTWSFVIAYACAVVAYQAGTFSAHPQSSSIWIIATCLCTWLIFRLLVLWGKQKPRTDLIPLKTLQS